MKYSILIYGQEGLFERLSPEEQEATLEQHRALQRDLERDGAFVTAKLMPVTSAVTLSLEGGDGQKTLVTDGPFMETKERFFGFYIVECETMEEAIAHAERILVPFHKLEVRPVEWSAGTYDLPL